MKYLVWLNILLVIVFAITETFDLWEDGLLLPAPFLMALVLCLPFSIVSRMRPIDKGFPWYCYAFIVLFISVGTLYMFDPGIIEEGTCRYVFSHNWRSGWGGGLMGTRFLICSICWCVPVLIFALISKYEGWSKRMNPVYIMFYMVGGWLFGVSVALLW